MIVIFLLGLNSLITISLSPPPSHPQNTCHPPGRETPAHRPPLSRVLRGGARGTHLWDPDPGPGPTAQSHPTTATRLTSPHRFGGHRHRWAQSSLGWRREPRQVFQASLPSLGLSFATCAVTEVAHLVCEPDQLFRPPPRCLTRVAPAEKGHEWRKRGRPGGGSV